MLKLQFASIATTLCYRSHLSSFPFLFSDPSSSFFALHAGNIFFLPATGVSVVRCATASSILLADLA
ncbi:hypothetical protein E2562_032376 [Oryza meyeriana var. granulata]|uniref:Uncharacterized protein n=1 Tax=Oryza meyeriana var. granulata TaxID=110450 RepID=A0A6G1CA27_9ORYZ|nr:hypothetical protein E2562_032376 [Oryza meyeriana var. granulata]